VPPYTQLLHTMWSPVLQSASTAEEIAAMPAVVRHTHMRAEGGPRVGTKERSAGATDSVIVLQSISTADIVAATPGNESAHVQARQGSHGPICAPRAGSTQTGTLPPHAVHTRKRSVHSTAPIFAEALYPNCWQRLSPHS
jgi:hypothetical protein